MDDSVLDEWELCNDDGFVYKRKKRRLSDPSATAKPPDQATDPEAEERSRRERRRKILLKLKKQYQKEIDQWELLSNTLHAMQEKALQLQSQQQRNHPLELPRIASDLGLVQRSEDGYGSLVDDLLLQAEAQEAIIHDASNLCNVAEAMCNAQEEQLKQLYIDLPVWSTPHDLMVSLCDE